VSSASRTVRICADSGLFFFDADDVEPPAGKRHNQRTLPPTRARLSDLRDV